MLWMVRAGFALGNVLDCALVGRAMKPQRANRSSSSVDTHLFNIEQKRGLINQAKMTLLAARRGLIGVTG